MSISPTAWHDGNSERYIKTSEVWPLPPLERSHGKGESSQGNLGCSSLAEGILRSKNVPWEALLLQILRPHRDAMPPPFTSPGSSWSDSHSSREQSWHRLKQAPLNRTGFSEVQWGTPLNQSFCRGNLLAYPASAPPLLTTGDHASIVLGGSRPRPNSILLSLDGIGLGQGAGPQSKCCGNYYRKFASCLLFPRPPTRRVPLKFSLLHCFFSSSFPMCLHTHMLTLTHRS